MMRGFVPDECPSIGLLSWLACLAVELGSLPGSTLERGEAEAHTVTQSLARSLDCQAHRKVLFMPRTPSRKVFSFTDCPPQG